MKGLHFPSGDYAPIRRASFATVESERFQASDGKKALKIMDARGLKAKFNPGHFSAALGAGRRAHSIGRSGNPDLLKVNPEGVSSKSCDFLIFLPNRVYLNPLIQQPSISLDSFVGRFKFLMTQADFDAEQSQYVRVHKNDITSLYEIFMNAYRSGYFYNTAAEDLGKAKQREALNASATLASPSPPPAAPPPSLVPTPSVPGTTSSDVELRAMPDLSSKPLSTVPKGTAVVISGRIGEMFKVAIAGGGEGYVPQTAIDVTPSLEQARTIQVSPTGTIPNTATIEQAGTKAVWRDETVVVQATIPSGAASDKATIGLKAALNVVDILRNIGVPMDKVIVSPTLHQGPELAVKLLNLPGVSVAWEPQHGG